MKEVQVDGARPDPNRADPMGLQLSPGRGRGGQVDVGPLMRGRDQGPGGVSCKAQVVVLSVVRDVGVV